MSEAGSPRSFAHNALDLARRGLRGPIGITAVLTVLVLSGLFGAVGAAHGAVAAPSPIRGTLAHAPVSVVGGTAAVGYARAASHTVSPSPLGPLPPAPSYGRGTFFTDSGFTQVPLANQSCINYYYGGSCTAANVTNDPVLNLTSTGTLAMAYTAFTNITPCGVLPVAETEIGFSHSQDGGTTWSTPIYLGNTLCDFGNESNFTNAWQPALTSLGNGTLVLAYVEFNLTSGYYTAVPYLNFGPYSYNVIAASLVVQESYDNGTTWSTPTVVNTSFNPSHVASWTPERPWLAAHGDTVYLTWMNETMAYSANYAHFPYTAQGSSQIHLVVSTNGGSSWGGQVDLPVVSENNTTDFWAANPVDTVLPNGDLVVAYDTNLTFCYPCIINGTYFYYYFADDLVAAVSANNGSSFTLTTISKTNFVESNLVGPYTSGNVWTLPMLAWSGSDQELYAGYGVETAMKICPSTYCYVTTVPEIFVANVSFAGTSPTWAWNVHLVTSLAEQGGQAYAPRFSPAVAVSNTGVVEVEATILNYSICAQGRYGLTCDAMNQLYTTSTTNGTSWSSAITIGPNWAFEPYSYPGERSSLIAQGQHVYIGWTAENCPGWNSTGLKYVWCDYPPPSSTWNYYNNGSAIVQFSELFEGVGLNISFSETGLIAGTPWTVNFGGNVRAALAPGTLAISGVPIGNLNVSWTVNSTSKVYGVRYTPTGSVRSPQNFTVNTTIVEHFDRQYLVEVSSVPFIPGYGSNIFTYGCYGQTYWDNKYCAQVNYNITPVPGQDWFNAGSSETLNVYPAGNFCGVSYGCYDYYQVNLTFQSWSGNGNGSTNTSANSTTITANGPLNETANFLYNAWCWIGYHTSAVCVNSNASVTFVESGLPKGTTWGVSTWGNEVNASTPSVSLTNNSSLAVSSPATVGVAYYSVWTVPGALAGTWWVPSTTPASPVQLPTQPFVDVTYTLSSSPPAASTSVVQAEGLATPTTQWSFGLDGNLYGQSTSEAIFHLSSGTHQFNATNVYLENGTGYYPSGLDIRPFSVNGSWNNSTSVPRTVTLDGDAYIVVQYSPLYRVLATASAGGNVSSAVTWVELGKHVVLNASASVGYLFVGWTGVGAGSVSSTQTSISVSATGPVQELATFRAMPPPRYVISVDTEGLFAGEAFTVTVGGVSYTGYGSLQVPNLLAGNYSFADMPVYANSTSLTQFVPTGMSTTYTTNGAGELEVGSDGYVNLTYTPQFALVVSSTGPGSTSPSGLTWQDNGTQVTLTATPASHYMLLGWNGSGPGSYTGTALTIHVTMSAGPVSEAAQFVYRPNPPPAVYRLTVQETGLPTGTSWGYSVAGTGASGSAGAGLTVGGLNGTYTLAVGIVPGATGVRYLPTNEAPSVPVTENRSYNVTFVTQYLLTVVGGTGGTVTGLGGWYNASSVVTLTAAAVNSSFSFVSWNSSTGSSATSPSLSVTMTGPVTETATFAAVYPTPHSTGSSTAGEPLALGLLGVLLLAGLLAGLVAGRRRRPPAAAAAPEPMEQWQSDSTGEGGSEGTESAPPAEGN